jgi:transposase
MTSTYSIDLQQHILTAWKGKEESQRQLTERFKVSLVFVRDFLKRYQETGEIAPSSLLR